MEFLSFKFAFFIFSGLLVFHFFQGVGAKRFVFLILNICFIYFLVPSESSAYYFLIFLAIGYGLIKIAQIRRKKITLFVSALSLVFLFLYFKNYSILYFIPRAHNLIFTIGTSYVLFRILHLLVDIHGGAIEEKISLLDYFNYTCFFLSFVSGPIMRYEDFKGQEKKFMSFEPDQSEVFMAFSRVVNGLIKIGIIAVSFKFLFGEFSFRIENIKFPMEITHACAALLYTQFLYFNFSGYMDVIIGIGRLFGFQLPENFNKPFMAANFLDFWSRWHITLSEWFKFYLFNPLLKLLTYRWPSPKASPYLGVVSFFVTFFVMGVWHGSTNIFIIYGLFLGLGVSLNKLYQINVSRWLGRGGYRAIKGNKIYCLICSAMTYSYFSFALTCLWASEERFFLIIDTLGIKGLSFGFATAVLISSCILFALFTLRTVWLNMSKVKEIFSNNYWCKELYLASKVFVIIFLVIEGNTPEFIYQWF
jgi:alginate O-acetyltransferase complex protein AlgI